MQKVDDIAEKAADNGSEECVLQLAARLRRPGFDRNVEVEEGREEAQEGIEPIRPSGSYGM
jgi:hypothetical protein